MSYILPIIVDILVKIGLLVLALALPLAVYDISMFFYDVWRVFFAEETEYSIKIKKKKTIETIVTVLLCSIVIVLLCLTIVSLSAWGSKGTLYIFLFYWILVFSIVYIVSVISSSIAIIATAIGKKIRRKNERKKYIEHPI